MVEYAIGLICGGAGAWLIAAHAWRERARQHGVACRAWADAHSKVEKERDGLRKVAADSADALARANSRTEAAETARMAALTRADAAEAELSRIRACVNGVKPCVPSR